MIGASPVGAFPVGARLVREIPLPVPSFAGGDDPLLVVPPSPTYVVPYVA